MRRSARRRGETCTGNCLAAAMRAPYLFDNSMTPFTIPAGAKIRVVGDVHGDVTGFGYALATDRFIVQLGDLADHGRDSASTLRMMFDRVEQGRGLFLLGNHDL